MSTAHDIMKTDLRTVAPGDRLHQVERLFTQKKVSGAPVVEDGRLVGIVSRSDLVGQMVVEQSVAELVSDWYRDPGIGLAPSDEVGSVMGEQMQHRAVRDVMTTKLITIAPDDDIPSVARAMLEHRVHRLPVAADGQLLGLVTTFDLLRVIAAG